MHSGFKVFGRVQTLSWWRLVQALVGLGPACTPVITIADEDKRKRHVVFKEGVSVLTHTVATPRGSRFALYCRAPQPVGVASPAKDRSAWRTCRMMTAFQTWRGKRAHDQA